MKTIKLTREHLIKNAQQKPIQEIKLSDFSREHLPMQDALDADLIVFYEGKEEIVLKDRGIRENTIIKYPDHIIKKYEKHLDKEDIKTSIN